MSKVSSAKRELRIRYWEKLIEAKQTSNLSLKDWCNENGVTKDAYYYWLRVIRERAIDNLPAEVRNSIVTEDKKHVTFQKLEIEPNLIGFQPSVVIHLKDATVEVPNGTNRETLEAVFMALKSTC